MLLADEAKNSGVGGEVIENAFTTDFVHIAGSKSDLLPVSVGFGQICPVSNSVHRLHGQNIFTQPRC